MTTLLPDLETCEECLAMCCVSGNVLMDCCVGILNVLAPYSRWDPEDTDRGVELPEEAYEPAEE